MKHTPGPWTCAGGCYINIQTARDPITDKQYRNIARVGVDNAHCPGYEECEANASLIMAAPDLLAACKSALAKFHISPMAKLDVADMLRAAIAKAESPTQGPTE